MMIIVCIPFIVVSLLLSLKVKDFVAVLIGIITAVIIYHFTGNASCTQSISLLGWLNHSVLSNLLIVISIYVLGFFMYLIMESSLIELIKEKLNNGSCRVVLIPVISGVFSEDDYLSSSITSMFATKLFGNSNISKRNIGLISAMLPIVFCILNPISSWNPVLIGAFKSSNIRTDMYYKGLVYNFIIIFFVITVIKLLLDINADTKPKNTFRKRKCNSNRGIIDIITILSVFILSFIIADKVLCMDYPIIPSGIIANVFAALWFLKRDFITIDKLKIVIKNTISEMTPLVILLLSIWSFVYVINDGLGIGTYIMQLIYKLNIGRFIPVIIFISSATFSYITGSSYGSFGLFIALAAKVSINLPETGIIITISAAISGSLFALFSVGSDVLGLCAAGTGCERSEIRKVGNTYAIKMFVWGIVGYIGLAIVPNIYHPIILIIISGLYYISINNNDLFSIRPNRNSLNSSDVFNNSLGVTYSGLAEYNSFQKVYIYFKNYWKTYHNSRLTHRTKIPIS